MWRRGDVVVLRFEPPGRALPLCVVEHSEEELVTYLAEGTEVAFPQLPDGRGLRDFHPSERWVQPYEMVKRPWSRSDVVVIFPSAREHSLWVFHEAGRHVGWYANLETPHRFGETTIATRDGVLDIWIPVETGEPVWKDEDEFEVAVEVGRISHDEAVALRAEGDRVIAERRWPTGWEDWRPSPDWKRPHLPPDWDAQA